MHEAEKAAWVLEMEHYIGLLEADSYKLIIQ